MTTAATPDFLAGINKRFDELAGQFGELKEMMSTHVMSNSIRNTAVSTLQDTVSGLAFSLRLKDRKVLSVPEAAKYIGRGPATIRRLLKSGVLKGVKRGSHQQARWGVRRSDLDILLERNVNQVTQIG